MFLALNEAILDARAHHFIFLHALKEPSDIIILGLELVIIFASRLILILNLFFLESSTDFIPFLKHVVRLTINVYMKWLKQYEKEALFYFSDNDHYLHHFQYDSFFFFLWVKTNTSLCGCRFWCLQIPGTKCPYFVFNFYLAFEIFTILFYLHLLKIFKSV